MFKRGAKWFAWNPATKSRETTGCSDKKAALAIVAGWERAAADPSYRDKTSKTLAHGYEFVITAKRREGRADGTIEMYEQKLRQFARVVGEHTLLQRLMDANVIDDFVATREREGVAQGTIFKELVTVRQLLTHCVRKGWATGDVKAIMPVGFSPKYVPRERFLPYEQWWDYVHAFHDERAGEVAWELGTGANENEVRRAMRSHATKTDVFIDGTKRASRKRHVPFTKLTRPFIEFALKHAPGGKDGPLFAPWANKGRDMHEAAVKAGLAHWVDGKGNVLGPEVGRVIRSKLSAKIVDGITSNDLRRSFGSVLAQQGVPFEIIAKCMGNSITMVMNVYGKLRPQDIRESVHRYIPDSGTETGTALPQLAAETAASAEENY